MQLLRLAVKNIKGNGFRSLAIFLAVMGVAGFLLATTLIIKGAEYSLDSGLKRLGADILVVPAGAENKVETALLMGKPTNIWMPLDNLQSIAAVPGVQAVSPQIYLSSLYGAACCSVSEMFMVVYDPATDFTVTPWLQKNLGRSLAKGEVIGGSYIFVPAGERHIITIEFDETLASRHKNIASAYHFPLCQTSPQILLQPGSNREIRGGVIDHHEHLRDGTAGCTIKRTEVDLGRNRLDTRNSGDALQIIQRHPDIGGFAHEKGGFHFVFSPRRHHQDVRAKPFQTRIQAVFSTLDDQSGGQKKSCHTHDRQENRQAPEPVSFDILDGQLQQLHQLHPRNNFYS